MAPNEVLQASATETRRFFKYADFGSIGTVHGSRTQQVWAAADRPEVAMPYFAAARVTFSTARYVSSISSEVRVG